MKSPKGWIGVDLDGTLANNDNWIDECHIGPPVPKMVERVKKWLAEGKDVRIMTARLSRPHPKVLAVRMSIDAWCELHVGQKLPITNQKDFYMESLWDDRAVQVIRNTGERADGKED